MDFSFDMSLKLYNIQCMLTIFRFDNNFTTALIEVTKQKVSARINHSALIISKIDEVSHLPNGDSTIKLAL